MTRPALVARVVIGSLVAFAVFLLVWLGAVLWSGLAYNSLASIGLLYTNSARDVIRMDGADVKGQSCFTEQVINSLKNSPTLPYCIDPGRAASVACDPVSSGRHITRNFLDGPEEITVILAVPDKDTNAVASHIESYGRKDVRSPTQDGALVGPKQIATKICNGYGLVLVQQSWNDIQTGFKLIDEGR